MKKMFRNLMLVAVAAMAFVACQNDTDGVNVTPEQDTITMTFVADAPESRTSVAIDGDVATYSWSEGDKVGFYYVDTDAKGKKKKNSNAAVISGSTATFTADFEKIGAATTYNIGAFYPGNSHAGHAEADFFNNVNVKIPTGQTLIEGTFDPAADLMMSKPFMGVALENDSVKSLEFTRIAAIGKMNLKLKGMEANEVIKNVKFSFAEGTHFTGPVTLDLEYSEYTLGTEGTSNAVTLQGELAVVDERTEIFFTCFPGEYSGAYTIEVETDKAKYSKEGQLSKALVFTAGNVLNFNATVGNRFVEKLEENEVVDVLNLAFTGASGSSYSDWSGKVGTSGTVYAGNNAGSNNSIQLRSKENNSGIITTATVGCARKIVVTWNTNTQSDRTLNIYGKNSAYSAATDLYKTAEQGTLLGTIVYGTSTELEIDGDYAYIGMRSDNGAMYLSEVKITWESDGLTPQTLNFSETACTATIGEEFTAPTLSGANTEVTYSSSNTAVATVNATTGAVTLVAAGTTTITASAIEADGYRAATASYTLTVKVTQGGGESITKTYTFSDYKAGTQYATNEVHELDKVLTITTTECHFTSELRIYSSDAHNGYAIGTLAGGKTIKSLGFNAGYKADTLKVYGSTDGSTWTPIKDVKTTSTYSDYSVDFGGTKYTQFKLDVKGSNQVRVKSLTLTYIN